MAAAHVHLERALLRWLRHASAPGAILQPPVRLGHPPFAPGAVDSPLRGSGPLPHLGRDLPRPFEEGTRVERYSSAGQGLRGLRNADWRRMRFSPLSAHHVQHASAGRKWRTRASWEASREESRRSGDQGRSEEDGEKRRKTDDVLRQTMDAWSSHSLCR